MVTKNKKFSIFSNIVLILLSLFCFIPIALMFMGSVTDEAVLKANGYSFLPAKFSIDAYKYIMNTADTIFRAYGITIFVTVVGTAISLLLTFTLAYALAKKNLPGRNILSFIVFFTMLFNGGLVPSFLTWTQIFHIRDTIWALILPNYLLSGFYVIMVRSYFTNSIPEEIMEAAKMDGCSEFKVLFRIVLPLSKPIIATVGLLVGLTYWNDWMNGLYYLLRRTDFYSIQNLLNKILSNADYLAKQSNAMSAIATSAVPSVGVRMAIAVIALLPILVIYPFVQKFFVKGIVIGGVKG